MTKNALLDKIRKNSTISETAILQDSTFFEVPDFITTQVPMMNVALSGKLDGGLFCGLHVVAGPSKNFKTLFSLIMAEAFLRKYPEGVLIFYDNEFGAPKKYFETLGIPLERIVHVPITDIEQLKHDIVVQLKNIERGDHVMIIIDSIGNVSSIKELMDTEAGKTTVDMTRSKSLKSLFRMITPLLTIKNVPMVVVNHTYKTLDLFSKDVVSGGTGPVYAAQNIWIVGRRQDKPQGQTEVLGYEFIINIEKSRFIKEKSKIPIAVSWQSGVEKYSGLLEVAMAGNYVVQPKQGWYAVADPKTGEVTGESVRRKDTLEEAFWKPIFEKTDFASFIEKQYSLGSSTPMLENLV